MGIMVDGKHYVVTFDDGVTSGQAYRVFLKYIAAHPEYENKTGDYVLTQAMLDSKLMRLAPELNTQTNMH